MKNSSYDAIIIGAGSVGAPLAWQLAEAGMNILVIDQFASVGQGSNKRAIGGIRATHSEPAKIRLCLKSLEIFSKWQEQHGDDIGWQQGGYCFVAYRPQEEKTLKDLLVIQKKFGLDIDWYDAKELLEIVPALASDGLIGGTFSPGDGSASPMLSALAFEKQARRCGAVFHYNEKIKAMDCQNGRITAIQTDKAIYQTGLVINAAGAWAGEVGALAGIRLPVSPDSHEGGITEAVSHFLRPMIVDIRPAEGSSNYYFYQHHTGQLIFCITPNPPIVGFDQRETSSFLPMVSRRMLGVMPRLKNLKVRRTWRGLYPNTPDGSPILGEVEGLKGYFNAVGMCGQGFMLGPGLAVYMRKLVTGSLDDDSRLIFEKLSLYRDFGKKEALK